LKVCDDDFGDPVELQSRWRIARKPHYCFACRETIRSADRYHFVVQNYDGELSTFKHCLRCWTMIREILDAGALSVQWNLDCGLDWEEAFGPLPEHVATLAFLTPDEAQERAGPD
jgi:hypothetical protein